MPQVVAWHATNFGGMHARFFWWHATFFWWQATIHFAKYDVFINQMSTLFDYIRVQ